MKFWDTEIVAKQLPRNTIIIGDVGSTHMGRITYAKDLIRIASEIGLDFIKFQLFRGEPYVSAGNIELPYAWWPELVDTAKDRKVGILASVFDEGALDLMRVTDVRYVKLAASKAEHEGLLNGIHKLRRSAIVSCSTMNWRKVSDRCLLGDISLYCISEYPVKYEISFDELFPTFDGFSDHTLGIRQTLRAIDAGAEWIEKHWKGPHPNDTVPDAQFALSVRQMEELCRKAR